MGNFLMKKIMVEIEQRIRKKAKSAKENVFLTITQFQVVFILVYNPL
jgi:hypothetical protein